MSWRTSCNYCNLKRIKANAKGKLKDVTVLRSRGGGLGGFDVYVHPPGHEPDTSTDPKTGNHLSPYFVAWMMEISKRCAC